MKINGKKIVGSNIVHIVIPRGDGNNHVFTAAAVLDMKEFYDLMAAPKPKMVMKAGGEMVPDSTDTDYLKRVNQYAEKRFDFIVIKSLQATEGLEWDTVNLLEPGTWGNYETELKEAGFVFNEIQLIMNGVMEANALSESKLVEARQSFLASLAEKQQSLLSQKEGQPATPSGDLVSVLTSDRPAS